MRETLLESDGILNETDGTQVRIEYESERGNISSYLDSKLDPVWRHLLKMSKPGSLFDRSVLNYIGVEDAYDNNGHSSDNGHCSIVCGPGNFRHYASKVALLNGQKNPADYDLTEEDLGLLESVRPLSSFPAITVNDEYLYVIMGKKGWNTLDNSAGKLSFVGAGFLDLEKDAKDLSESNSIKDIDEVIAREVYEETTINNKEMNELTILGVAEDRFKGGHWQPAIFSLVESSLSRKEIKNRKNIAEDAWEFEGPYVFVPVDEEVFEALIDSDKSCGNIPMKDSTAKKIDGIGNKKTVDTTGKAGAMLFLAGRSYFGNHWFYDQLAKHKEHVKFTYT